MPEGWPLTILCVCSFVVAGWEVYYRSSGRVPAECLPAAGACSMVSISSQNTDIWINLCMRGILQQNTVCNTQPEAVMPEPAAAQLRRAAVSAQVRTSLRGLTACCCAGWLFKILANYFLSEMQ